MSDKFDELYEIACPDANQVYSAIVIDHARYPRNLGVLPDDDAYARIVGQGGETMEIWIRVRQGTISKAHFMTDSCGTSIASGSMVTTLALGQTSDEARRISQQDIINALGGLPEDSQHCALLASNTLRAAIEYYLALHRDPWKKSYRKY